MQMNKVLTHACLKNSTDSEAKCVHPVSVWSLESLGQRAFLLCSEKMGEEQTGREQKGERMQGNQDSSGSCTNN